MVIIVHAKARHSDGLLRFDFDFSVESEFGIRESDVRSAKLRDFGCEQFTCKDPFFFCHRKFLPRI